MNRDTLDALEVIVVNDFCYVQGGASRVAIDEAVGLAGAGVKVTFVGGVGPVCEELNTASVTVVNLNEGELSNFLRDPGVALRGLWNRSADRIMRTELRTRDRRNTIVHLHGYTKSLSSSVLRFAAESGFSVVVTLHDFFAACPNGAFFNFVENKPCQLRALSASCIATNCDKRRYAHKLYRVARALTQRHIGNFPNAVGEFIALSNKSAELLRPYLPKGARVHLLSNPSAVERQPPVEVATRTNVIAIGRLDAEKGIGMLVDAARRTKSRLILVGEGPWRSYAEAYEGCRVTGWLTRREVMEELEQARCLVFPSLWYETYGLVVEEAAARGVPPIVSDVSAAAERVKNGVTGWHVRAGDTEDLVRCLNVVKDDTVVRKVGLAAFENHWLDPSTTARHTAALVNIYRDVLRAHSI
jgi:glycosyltransferase involved in cell wall biosynthesis